MDSLGIPGVLRGSAQQMLAPSNTAIRIYNVHFVATDSPSNMVLANAAGTVTVTGTNALARITIPIEESSLQYVGNFSDHHGVRFPNGVFIQTGSPMSYYTIVYSTEA